MANIHRDTIAPGAAAAELCITSGTAIARRKLLLAGEAEALARPSSGISNPVFGDVSWHLGQSGQDPAPMGATRDQHEAEAVPPPPAFTLVVPELGRLRGCCGEP